MPYVRREQQQIEERHALYIFARCEQLCEDYARSNEINAVQLARRVADLLSAQTGGKPLGTVDNLSSLRGSSGGGSIPVAEVEMARGSRGRAQNEEMNGHRRSNYGKPYKNSRLAEIAKLLAKGLSYREVAEQLGDLSTAGVGYYAKHYGLKREKKSMKGKSYGGKHWTQLPKNKARLRKQMKKTREAVVAAGAEGAQ